MSSLVGAVDAASFPARKFSPGREPPYEYDPVKPPIDILYGSSALREGLDRGETAATLAATWSGEMASFVDFLEKYLLY